MGGILAGLSSILPAAAGAGASAVEGAGMASPAMGAAAAAAPLAGAGGTALGDLMTIPGASSAVNAANSQWPSLLNSGLRLGQMAGGGGRQSPQAIPPQAPQPQGMVPTPQAPSPTPQPMNIPPQPTAISMMDLLKARKQYYGR
jgi:hypothetical protein